MRRELSEATLDALAAARSTRSLPDAIELHRDLYKADIFVAQLHERTGEPEETDPKKVKRKINKPGIGTTGMPFTYAFKRFLDDEYGHIFPWSRSFMAMRQILCRKTHPQHRARREWRGSLCSQLVSFAVRRVDPTTGLHFTVPQICQVMGVSPDRGARTLHHALRWIEADMDRRREIQEQRQKADAGQHDWREAPHVHEPLAGLHKAECEQCRRIAG